jgi:hypothetical protein
MKKVILCFSVIIFAVACTNEASKENSAADSLATDSSANVVLPSDRSSDSLAIPPASPDNTGVKKDSSK